MKRIAVTVGDPGGIGPEVVVKALQSPELAGCLPVIIGDLAVVREALVAFGIAYTIHTIDSPAEAFSSPGVLWLYDCRQVSSFRKNASDAQNGSASVAYVRKAVHFATEKTVSAVVTGPISKEALKMAGFPWPGHTEMLADFTGTRNYAMMLAGGPLRVILVSIHTALKNVPGLITRESVLRTIRLAGRACDMMGLESPRIAVAGLNPHAGEAGMFGDEEREAIRPAVEEARKEGIPAEGPYPPDIVFYKAFRGECDIVVSMYHDQGLIPLKMIAFDTGVNVTVGLPIIRTSPDHGTAYDIAWKGVAHPSSMIEAIRIASILKL